jgi:hypothetical protein
VFISAGAAHHARLDAGVWQAASMIGGTGLSFAAIDAP